VTQGARFEEFIFASRSEALVEISSGVPDRVVRALLAAALESPDSSWVEACALSLSVAADSSIRRAALLALGHLGRRFGTINADAIGEVLNRLGMEDNLRGVVDDLRDDLRVYGVDVE
jgi:hypothetical protein